MIAYFVERFSPAIFVPAALGIAAAVRVASSGSDASWLVDSTLALLLIAQFRLWDDLADREVDRVTHPARVLVRAERIGPYVTVCVALALVNLLAGAWRGGWLGLVVLAALDVSFVAWYFGRSSQRTVIGALWMLAKYSVFVIVMTARSSIFSHLLPAVVAIYAAAIAYEVWHEPSSPLARATAERFRFRRFRGFGFKPANPKTATPRNHDLPARTTRGAC
jgi:hypothetical protein